MEAPLLARSRSAEEEDAEAIDPEPPKRLHWYGWVVVCAVDVLGPFSTDAFIPSLPKMAHELGASTAVAGLTLQLNWIAKGLATLVVGASADGARCGRRGTILWSLAFYTVGAYAASVVPRSPRGAAYLIVARMVQGVGEASTIVCSAIARDVLTDVGARVKVTSALGALRPLATVVAPSVGGLVGAGFGWRVLFKALAVWGAALWVLSLVALPETRPAETTSSSLFAGLALVGRRILKRRADLSQDVRLAVASMLVVAFGFAGVMAFLSTISILLETRFGRSVVTTSLLMGSIPVGIILTNAGVAALFRTTQPTAADHHHRRRGATTEHGSTGGGSSAAIALSVRLVRGSAGGMLTAGLLARGTASLDDVNIGIGKCDPGHHTRTCMITRRLGFAGVAPRRPFRTTYPPMLATIYLFALTQAAGVGAAMALALQPFGDVAASAAAVTNLLRTGVSVAVSQLATDLVQYFGVRGLFWVLAFAGASAYLAAHLYLGRGVHTPRPPPKESLLDEPSSAEISSTRRGTTP